MRQKLLRRQYWIEASQLGCSRQTPDGRVRMVLCSLRIREKLSIRRYLRVLRRYACTFATHSTRKQKTIYRSVVRFPRGRRRCATTLETVWSRQLVSRRETYSPRMKGCPRNRPGRPFKTQRQQCDPFGCIAEWRFVFGSVYKKERKAFTARTGARRRDRKAKRKKKRK